MEPSDPTFQPEFWTPYSCRRRPRAPPHSRLAPSPSPRRAAEELLRHSVPRPPSTTRRALRSQPCPAATKERRQVAGPSSVPLPRDRHYTASWGDFTVFTATRVRLPNTARGMHESGPPLPGSRGSEWSRDHPLHGSMHKAVEYRMHDMSRPRRAGQSSGCSVNTLQQRMASARVNPLGQPKELIEVAARQWIPRAQTARPCPTKCGGTPPDNSKSPLPQVVNIGEAEWQTGLGRDSAFSHWPRVP